MNPRYIYFKTFNLDDENNFNTDSTKEEEVEQVRFFKKNRDLLTGLNINLKIEGNLAKW